MQKVLAAILEKNGKILIAQRKKGDRFEGLWEFPGGKLEPGETPEEGLKRELREEFHIKTRVEHFLCSVRCASSAYPLELLAYKVVYVSGRLTLHDHAAIRWVSLEEAGQYPLIEPDAAIVGRLKKLASPEKQ